MIAIQKIKLQELDHYVSSSAFKKECDKTNKSVEKIKKFFLIKSIMNL